MYRLFYTPKTAKDVLYVIIKPEVYPDEVKTLGEVTVLYANKELIGLNFAPASKLFNLASEGMIPAPSAELLDKINALLEDKGLEPLPPYEDSLYRIATLTLKEEHPFEDGKWILTFSLNGEKIETVSRYPNLKEGERYVLALAGCIKFDATQVITKTVKNIKQEAEVCSPFDLRVGEEKTKAYEASSLQEGGDFYLGGK